MPSGTTTLGNAVIGTASSFDTINVTGTANLGTATLSLNIASNAVAIGNTLIIIDNDLTDAFIGTFAGLAQGSTLTTGGFSFTASYIGGSGNDFTLTTTAVPEPSTWLGGGLILGLAVWSQRKRLASLTRSNAQTAA